MHIEQGPASLLVPAGIEAKFTCTVFCTRSCDIDWTIGNVAVNPYHRARLEEKGYHFFNPVRVNNTYMARFTVNATFDHNNTLVSCTALLNGENTHGEKSDNAILIVLAGIVVKIKACIM